MCVQSVSKFKQCFWTLMVDQCVSSLGKVPYTWHGQVREEPKNSTAVSPYTASTGHVARRLMSPLTLFIALIKVEARPNQK